MEQYNVTGMSCAACSTRVEKAVSKVPGVTSCSVSLLTNSMGANDVYIINSKEHGEVLLPAIKECILNVDLESNTMTIHLMKGLI